MGGGASGIIRESSAALSAGR
jgi:sodium/potassium-transporting ATPase subunit alpha